MEMNTRKIKDVNTVRLVSEERHGLLPLDYADTDDNTCLEFVP